MLRVPSLTVNLEMITYLKKLDLHLNPLSINFYTNV